MRWQKLRASSWWRSAACGAAICLFTLSASERPVPTPALNGAADPDTTVQSGKGTQFRFSDGDQQIGPSSTGSTRQYDDGRERDGPTRTS